ncbi:MAG: hypothetical protein ACK448_05340, partial [Bacteroidota bacterium]
MKKTVMSQLTPGNLKKHLAAFVANKRVRQVAVAASVLVYACAPADTGDLTGVQGRRPWFHPTPPGMVYIP